MGVYFCVAGPFAEATCMLLLFTPWPEKPMIGQKTTYPPIHCLKWCALVEIRFFSVCIHIYISQPVKVISKLCETVWSI